MSRVASSLGGISNIPSSPPREIYSGGRDSRGFFGYEGISFRERSVSKYDKLVWGLAG